MGKTDTRTRCRCHNGGCACVRNGRAVTTPAVLTAAARSGRVGGSVPTRTGTAPAPPAGARLDAQRYAYRLYADVSGAAPLGQATVALVATYADLHAAGRVGQAAVVLRALRRHAVHRRDMRTRAQLDELEARVYGPLGALVRQVERRERAQQTRAAARFRDLEQRLFGETTATGRALWRRVHPGQPYPATLRARAVSR